MLRSRLALIVAFVFLAIFGAISYAGLSAGAVMFHLISDGGVLLAWLIAAGGIGGILIPWFGTPSPGTPGEGRGEGDFEHQRVSKSEITLTPALSRGTGRGSGFHLITAFALGLGAISLLTLALGLLGLLHHASAITLVAAGVILAVIQLNRTKIQSADVLDWLKEAAGWSWLWLVACPFAAVALVAAMFPPGILWRDGDPAGYDVVEYHLQVPREWFEAGRIIPLPHNVFSFFPMNVEMHYLLAMHLAGGPWAAMYLAQLMHLAFLALFVAAVYTFLLQVAKPLPAVTGALAVATVPWVTQLGAVAYDEGGFLLFGTLAIAWVCRAISEDKQRSRSLIVAGAMAGFSCGAKLTAVPEVLIALAIACTIFLLWQKREKPWTALRAALLFSLVSLLTFAPWLLRNETWARNPLFPEAARVLGTGDFTPVQVERWQRAHSPRPDQQSLSARLSAGWWQVLASWQYGYLLIPLAALGAALTWRRGITILLAGLFLAIAAFWLFATHLQGRFFVLALPLCACLIAQLDRPALSVTAIVVVLLSAGISGLRLNSEISNILHGGAELLGVPDISAIESNYLVGLAPGQPVVLVGDAKAFFYTIPMSQLHYRTVFDVGSASGDLPQDWNGGPLPSGARVIVDPGELERFHNTYWKLPEIPGWVLRDAPRDQNGQPMPYVER